MSDAVREDLFVSVGLSSFRPTPAALEAIQQLARSLKESFRYHEIVVVTLPDLDPAFLRQLREIRNCRVAVVRQRTGLLRRRQIAASEAIGDVVLITSAEELPLIDHLSMIADAERADAVIVAEARGGIAMFNPLIRLLGRSAGFMTDARTLHSAAYPRPILTELLRHPDSLLALRFTPVDPRFPVQVRKVAVPPDRSHSLSEVIRRTNIVFRLLVNSAATVLSLVAIGSIVLFAGAAAYAVYAVINFFVKDDLAPGWFTTSLMLSSLAMFLGMGMFGIAMGLVKLLENDRTSEAADVIEEHSSLELFAETMGELNVDAQVPESTQGRTPG